jgi:methionyl aminopeptidase
MNNMIKTSQEIHKIRKACEIVAEVLAMLKSSTQIGKNGKQMDELAKAMILTYSGAEPAFLGYRGYPSNICVSVNQTLIHGIPNSVPFQEGDLISYDVGVRYQGYYGDGAISMILGVNHNPKINQLLKVTEGALQNLIPLIKPGITVGTIGA